MAKRSPRLVIGHSTRGPPGALGVFAQKGLTWKAGQYIASFGGNMRLKTVHWVSRHAPWWSRYGISVPSSMAARFGCSLDSPYVLIPLAHTRQDYIYGVAPPSTPLEMLAAEGKGALLNCIEPGESAHVYWKIFFCEETDSYDVRLFGRNAFTSRGDDCEILIDYGPTFMAAIAADKRRAAAMPPPRKFVRKGVYCGVCAKVFSRITFLAHKAKSCTKKG